MNLSIIIPTWNTALVTQKAIDSIKKHLKNIKYEIIVIDNGSTDQTKNLLSSYKDVIYLRNKTNLGFSKANNIAAKKASGEYLFFMNSDMELIDNSLTSMLDYLKSHPKIGLIGPKFLNPNKTPQASVFPPQTPKNAFKEYFLRIKAYSKYLPFDQNPVSVWALSGGAILISHKFFLQIGGWDESYFMYFEDLELCRTIRNLNKLIYYYPACQIIHRHGFSGRKIADSANQWRRLIPGSTLFHGLYQHRLISLIIWSGQKLHHYWPFSK
ncbi:hypothetical protein A2410_01285 [Candidatus Shapirobacteria bacterium RIFOXYC1_FULL_38_24]|uniref:Glycosyl transferase family 2 n=4 Tax=Patescibacteria group TaxID=1783273 RepID=A0A0G0K5T5_9BACT|nr:MAG: Glycosyl transferase family 2 [Candidatus Shapirobacteria bacterium GW2011_GWE2_38_30]KKQ92605.1 MAG: Glycosyl transferase family 2 [Candidatus Shapirobacteria bacterium GW2011_GWE1_38_92]OGJ05597.1 MAG: hypothetical protein A2192_00165 [Candidatus Nomurabacteria bacterium RIFOXYA1_FULL_35_17]OGL57159.1 MAG: hypothetical protein A2367_01105 [Candidatus Shapirobacteria bacterium RIFOXYB1_FULL_38_38]OGL57905.1 MAG: hypothetical protein A2410_01285 [Candidatus Shapirobacteria bacterium RIF